MPCWLEETSQQDFINNLKQNQRLAMPVPLYVNAGDSSPKNLKNPSLCPENRLNLLPEQRDKISLQKGSIRNPMAYFVSLKNRLLKGQLDLIRRQKRD